MFLMLYLIYTQAITVGQFFSLFIYSFFIFGPLQELGNIINIYRETEVVAEHLRSDPADSEGTEAGEPDAADRSANAGVRRRRRSSTSRRPRRPSSDISFEVTRGETIAFVGPSGAGKTTLVKLLVGLYRPQDAGTSSTTASTADQIDLDDLRERIGFVTQDTQLFSGTIRENLLFVNPAATDAECLEVLRKAACDSLLARADHGLDTRHRRGRREGVGRREAAALDRAGAAAPAAPARVRRSDVVARFADRRRDQPRRSATSRPAGMP